MNVENRVQPPLEGIYPIRIARRSDEWHKDSNIFQSVPRICARWNWFVLHSSRICLQAFEKGRKDRGEEERNETAELPEPQVISRITGEAEVT